jgi:hypothetical protein
LTLLQHQPQPEVIDAGVVADGSDVLHALGDQRGDEVLRDAAQPEAAHAQRRTIGNVGDGLRRRREDLVARLHDALSGGRLRGDPSSCAGEAARPALHHPSAGSAAEMRRVGDEPRNLPSAHRETASVPNSGALYRVEVSECLWR